ncbi:MAG: hypothetical protein AB7T49_09215 [Oligoflexales bacterium]
MTYIKNVIDNPVCSRRFHLAYDDQAAPTSDVEVKCPFCAVTIFKAENHPPVKLLRQENLIKDAALSDNIITQCNFKDTFPKREPQVKADGNHDHH